MADRDEINRQLVERLRGMESDALQERLKRGHFADHAVGLARAELISRGVMPERPSPSAPSQDAQESQDMVIVERRLNPVEANILKSALSAGGVPAIVDDANAAHCFGYLAYALDGVRVRVPENHLARAREIISDIQANRFMLEDGEHAANGSADDESENAQAALPEPDVRQQRLLAYTQDASLAQRWTDAVPCMPGFLWSALLFGSIWFFYRKLYRTGALLFLIESLLLCGIATSGISHVSLIAFLATRVLIACTAEGLYYARARTIIQRTSKAQDNEASLQALLQQRGGVSFPAALCALLAHRLLTYTF